MHKSVHSTRSSYREMLIEHLFIGELLRAAWRRDLGFIEVLKPQVDDAGYDVVFEVGNRSRHVQLKASFRKARTAVQKIHVQLGEKPGGCVVWVQFDLDTLDLGPFLWFGGETPRDKLPDMLSFKIAKHTKGDSSGKKAERPNIRVVPKSKFDTLDTIDDVLVRLFGA